MKILKLTRMGGDFNASDSLGKVSDVGNYRVETRSDLVHGKDGKDYFLSFTHGYRRKYHDTNMRTGKPLKHPYFEILSDHALCVENEYDNDRGTWLNLKLERELHDLNLDFTLAGILEAVNYVAAEPYDAVEILDR